GHGYQADADSGLMLLGARYYDASIGRFISRDPIGYEGGLNLYAYCEDDPVDGADATGLDVGWARSPFPNDPYGRKAADAPERPSVWQMVVAAIDDWINSDLSGQEQKRAYDEYRRQREPYKEYDSGRDINQDLIVGKGQSDKIRDLLGDNIKGAQDHLDN